MDSNTLMIPNYKQRLEAREQNLEQRANKALTNLKQKETYLKTHGKEMLSDVVVGKVSSSNPFIGRFIGKFLGRNTKNNRTSQLASNGLFTSGGLISRFSRLGSVIIPLLYTIGERKLLSYSFRGAGKLLKFTIRNLFGFRKKRRK